MGCQINIAEKMVDREADYLLAIKETQTVLLDDVKEAFANEKPNDTHKECQVGHGRVETRLTSVLHDTEWICRNQTLEWKNFSSLVKLVCTSL